MARRLDGRESCREVFIGQKGFPGKRFRLPIQTGRLAEGFHTPLPQGRRVKKVRNAFRCGRNMSAIFPKSEGGRSGMIKMNMGQKNRIDPASPVPFHRIADKGPGTSRSGVDKVCPIPIFIPDQP
jgi:hypothetical protein